MQKINIYAVAEELILKGFSNIRTNALLKSRGERGTLNGFSETIVNAGQNTVYQRPRIGGWSIWEHGFLPCAQRRVVPA